jgi:hypothetical protein
MTHRRSRASAIALLTVTLVLALCAAAWAQADDERVRSDDPAVQVPGTQAMIGVADSERDLDCRDFDTQEQAQEFFESRGGPDQDPHRLDEDGDGRACENLPREKAEVTRSGTVEPGVSRAPNRSPLTLVVRAVQAQREVPRGNPAVQVESESPASGQDRRGVAGAGSDANCHPSYEGACLDPNARDYDCEGGGGDGPQFVQGPIGVVGDDPFELDREGDGVACEDGAGSDEGGATAGDEDGVAPSGGVQSGYGPVGGIKSSYRPVPPARDAGPPLALLIGAGLGALIVAGLIARLRRGRAL